MGALTLLIGFFAFFPLIALLLVVAAVAIAVGVAAGATALLGGLATYLLTAAVPAGVARLVRSKP